MAHQLAEFIDVDLESLAQPGQFGATVTLADVVLGKGFAPGECDLMLARMRRSTGVLIPASVAYVGADVRLQHANVYDGWQVLHVGPAKFSKCLAEFTELLNSARTAPMILEQKPAAKRKR